MVELIVREGTHGRGVFTREGIPAGTKVLRYGGPLLRYRDTTPQTYAVQIGPNLYLGGSGGIDDYVNHCCEPNCALLMEGTVVDLVAIREIAAGEELFFDYSTTMDEDDFEMTCHCGAPSCRKLVRDGKHLPDDVWERYAQLHMLPGYVRESRRRLRSPAFIKN
jgi:uncharacterized protein